MPQSNPDGEDQSKVKNVACGLLPFTCGATHYGSPPNFLSPPWLTTASPFPTADGVLNNMDMTGMRTRQWALGTSTVTGSSHQPPAATSGITALSSNGALRNNVRGHRGLRGHGPIHTCVQCVCILRQKNAG